MEPTPIFAALTDADHGPARGVGRRAAGGGGRSVTELLCSLRDDEPAPSPTGTRVGHVPDLLTFRD